jgi:hypothetical protein
VRAPLALGFGRRDRVRRKVGDIHARWCVILKPEALTLTRRQARQLTDDLAWLLNRVSWANEALER